MRIVVRHLNGSSWVQLLANNNRILLFSETYYDRGGARRAGKKLAHALRLPFKEVEE